MTDLLVTIFVVSILLALMLPALEKVKRSSERIVCASNLRQVGLAVYMYADDNRGRLPFTRFVDPSNPDANPLDTVVVRTPDGPQRHHDDWRLDGVSTPWDGFGLLIDHGYLSTGEVLYCPAHHGPHPYSRYADAYHAPQIGDSELVGNFQYRGGGPNLERNLDYINSSASLASDGFRSVEELNHKDGMNVLNAGLSVAWQSRSPQDFAAFAFELVLSNQGQRPDAAPTLPDAWTTLDRDEEQQEGRGRDTLENDQNKAWRNQLRRLEAIGSFRR